ncbi:MAG TPA: sigma-70 family RNA polymerase sigma factor [Labilithrix sp.]|nr:sigma-70 family RNA polymerase sigma factor [Labilithrix sp.]
MTENEVRAQKGGEGQPVPPARPLVDPSFTQLFEEHFGFVCRSLQRLGVREADMEDIAQELFLAVHRALPESDRTRPIRPWLFGFAVRYASNYRRLSWHRGRELDDVPVSPKLHDKLAAKRTVIGALERLDFDKRVVLVMHDLEEFTAPEIAEQLGIPLNTVYSRVRLAREAFRGLVPVEREEGAQ